MQNKYILSTLIDGVITTTEYKSLQQIAKDLKIEYYRVKMIYKLTNKPNNKYNQKQTQELLDMFQIRDVPFVWERHIF
jgi:hypothetical protein